MATLYGPIAATVVIAPDFSASTVSLTPVPTVESSQPKFTTSVISMAAAAVLDSSGLTRKIYDVQNVSEALELAFGKVLADTVTAEQQLAILARKRLFDSVSTSDSVVATLVFIRDFFDSVTPTDTPALQFSRPLASSVALSDRRVVGVGKVLADSITAVAGAPVLQFGKTLTDAISFTEQTSYAFSKVFDQDTVSFSEAVSSAVSKVLADSIGSTEQTSYAFNKVLADGVGINDHFDAGDGNVFSFAKSINNVVFTGETARYYNMAKQLSISQAVASAGSLVSQGYCDITYFEADYVGEFREFT